MTAPTFSPGDRVLYQPASLMVRVEFRQLGPAPIQFDALVTDVCEVYHAPAYGLRLLDGSGILAYPPELTLLEANAEAGDSAGERAESMRAVAA